MNRLYKKMLIKKEAEKLRIELHSAREDITVHARNVVSSTEKIIKDILNK